MNVVLVDNLAKHFLEAVERFVERAASGVVFFTRCNLVLDCSDNIGDPSYVALIVEFLLLDLEAASLLYQRVHGW